VRETWLDWNFRQVGPTPEAGPKGGRASSALLADRKATSPAGAGNGDARGFFAGHFLDPQFLIVWRGLLGGSEERALAPYFCGLRNNL
jgi:hypothetical protein